MKNPFSRKQQVTTPYTHNAHIVVEDGDEDYLSMRPSTKALFVSTLFTAAFFIRPIHMAIPIVMIVYGNLLVRLLAYFIALIFFISFVIPPRPAPSLVNRLLSPILEYFEYDEIIHERWKTVHLCLSTPWNCSIL
jgi:hypothetical protein